MKAKVEIEFMARQLESSVEKGYELTIESFKTEAKNKDLRDYYHCILKILVTLPYVHFLSQDGEEVEGSSSSKSVNVLEATDVRADEEYH